MPEFDVWAVIDAVADESDVADPKRLAVLVSTRVPKVHATTALNQVLPVVLQHRLSQRRPVAPPRGSAPDGLSGLSKPTGSRKVEGIRSAWAAWLRQRISVSPNEWKLLADCTAEDLEYSAGLNDRHAQANQARAEMKRRLAKLLEEHEAKTVKDLPQEALAEFESDTDAALPDN